MKIIELDLGKDLRVRVEDLTVSVEDHRVRV